MSDRRLEIAAPHLRWLREAASRARCARHHVCLSFPLDELSSFATAEQIWSAITLSVQAVLQPLSDAEHEAWFDFLDGRRQSSQQTSASPSEKSLTEARAQTHRAYGALFGHGFSKRLSRSDFGARIGQSSAHVTFYKE